MKWLICPQKKHPSHGTNATPITSLARSAAAGIEHAVRRLALGARTRSEVRNNLSRAINEAKKEETRFKRIDKCVDMLKAGKRAGV